jgi:hypothetical protein
MKSKKFVHKHNKKCDDAAIVEDIRNSTPYPVMMKKYGFRAAGQLSTYITRKNLDKMAANKNMELETVIENGVKVTKCAAGYAWGAEPRYGKDAYHR